MSVTKVSRERKKNRRKEEIERGSREIRWKHFLINESILLIHGNMYQ